MEFYQNIAAYYENVFPFNEVQLQFIKNAVENSSKFSVLDIGCGTGSLSIELAAIFDKVVAIDLDETMLKKAREKNNQDVRFLNLNMLNIEKEFGHKAFDTVICFGNTLVHLDGTDEISNFFVQAKHVLKKNGKLLFQIINYDRIIDQHISGLPTIENDQIKFVRNYHYRKETNRLDFETILTIKESGPVIRNKIPLFPIRKNEITALLNRAGFSNIRFYGNFKRDILTSESIPLVVEAS